MFPIDEVGNLRLLSLIMEPELRANLLALATAYGAAMNMEKATVAQRALGDWRFFQRLEDKDTASFTVRKYDGAVLWFSSNWPEGLDWPASISRPATRDVAA